ncbi:unnamed protein product [Urochloa decumbens]|uniref:Serine/threonine-protein kinase BSK1-like TPR repeats domain-containing protein n=1 Tax=Urochloa decumbens TaxID=240449 RepID=A0ABC9E7H0_9POAL
MAAPYVHRGGSSSDDRDALLAAALDGDLGRFKGTMKNLGIGNGDGAAVFSIHKYGYGVLHCAASQGHLEVCKYLVEDLGGDANMPASEGVTPFMVSVLSGNVSLVKYLLDHGGDPMKADTGGSTVLQHAARAGSCKITEFLLSRGIPVDMEFGRGTPLFHALTSLQDDIVEILLDHHANPNTVVIGGGTPLIVALTHRSLKCMKLLIKAGADVNGKGSVTSPLSIATEQGGYTDFIRFLLKAGADPNIPDDLGRLPIQLAALNDCKDEVEMLFPLTSPIPNVPKWSIDGVISHAKLNHTKPLAEVRKVMLKSEADKAFRAKDYEFACTFYGLAIDYAPDATLYSNRSLCKLQMGDGEGALLDAYQCRMMRPGWAKAVYRQAAAHMLLKEYPEACDALLDAQNLDPTSAEIEKELRKAMEFLKISPDEKQ